MTAPDLTSVSQSAPFWQRARIMRMCALTLVLAGVAYLLTRHTSHVLSYPPYVVLLACPLMHLMLHRHRHK